ncbi:MAG: pilin [Candidatus Pacebacteria bacterium]|nr:pilin [Candidatus Paceibacterota bacterium]
MKRFLTSIILISLLLAPIASLALELSYPEINIPGLGKVKLELDMDLGELILWFYYLIIGISGIAAFVMITWGGIEWLVSSGSPSRIGDAKDKIYSALLGLLIIFTSWLILKTIDPSLTIIQSPVLPH